MAKHISKNIKKTLEQFDQTKEYSLTEAIEIIKKISYVKFDASVDLAFNLNLDTRKAEQQLRGSILLPNGTGKNIRVLVASDDPKNQELSKSAGADIVVSSIELEEILKKGIFEFDIMVAEPKMMITLGKYGKVLGPKGLMPNPKTGTVTPEPAKAVIELKKGKANYRADKAGIVHSLIGKISMDTKSLAENCETVIALIKKLKPSTIKGAYLLNLTISSTMGPSIKIKKD
ncbi:MAG: 50S ribosomal protein L1 [Mycoplasmataceae bacterium]|nr:50S ribosomal protein L1 [Mycoplasmataceae bacterium]